MSAKYQFKDRGANLMARGFVRDCMYDVTNRKEIPTEPGNYQVTIFGPGLEKSMPIRETTLNKEFLLIHPEPVPETLQPPVHQMPIQQIPTPAPTPAPTGTPQPAVTGAMIIDAITNLSKQISSLDSQRNLNSALAAQVAAPAQDLLLSELLKLNFTSLKLNLIRADNTTSVVLIIDGMPPLSINAKNVSAADIVKEITSAFTENAMTVSSILQWKKSLNELLAETEKKVKAAKSASENAGKETTSSTANTAKKPDEKSTVRSRRAEAEKKAAEQATLVIPEEPDLLDDEENLEKDLENQGYQEQIPNDEFPIEDANPSGLSSAVQGFQLL